MSSDNAAQLINEILERYHEPHRRDLPRMRELAARIGFPGLAQEIEALEALLEEHMFKEEMRLFPMIVGGGDRGLLPHLIQDMVEEHEHIDEQARALGGSIRALEPALGRDRQGEAGELLETSRRFLEELSEHATREDEELFPPFAQPGPPLTGTPRS